MNPAPNIRHQTVSIRLAAALYNFVEQASLGHVFAAHTDVLLTDHAGGRYQRVHIGDAITTPLLPGLTLPLRDIFAM